MDNMDNINFYQWVKKMRDSQKEYFRTRDNRILQRAKMLEKIVDELIFEHQANNKKEPRQLNLFD